MTAPQRLGSAPQVHRRQVFGRARERARLFEGLAEVARGRGRLWLLCGEPGIGKTTLAEEVEQEAREQGYLVVWGRSWQAGGAPAFWPWCEALRSLVAEQADARALFDRETAALAHILPELCTELVPAPVSNAEEGRFQLFLAVRALLTRCARVRPVALVLDDLHAADRATLLLLEFVAQSLRSLPVLVIGTYREVEARLDPEIGRRLAEIGRLGATLPLGRLEPGAASDWVHAEVPELLGEPLARLLGLAQGNPLFLDQLLRQFLADRSSLEQQQPELPHGVREVIGERLARLPVAVQAWLEVGAVIGDAFDLGLAADVGGADRALLEDATASARWMGILTELDRGHWRFSHALYREVLYRRLSPARRASLHGAVVTALERRHQSDPRLPLVELAHHSLAAGPDASERAVDYAIRAAASCYARLAYDDAASVLEQAQALLDRSSGQPNLRGRVLLARGQLRIQLGDVAAGQSACKSAAEIAAQLGDAELLAQAALGYGFAIVAGLIDPTLVELLSRALAQLGDGPRGDVQRKLRVRVMARLAAARHPGHDAAESIQLARDAIALAREQGDAALLLDVLHVSLSVLMDFVDPRERLPLNRELSALALEQGDRHKHLRSLSRLFFDHAELGEFSTAATYIEAYERLARELHLEHVLWRALLFRSMLALAQGEFAAVDRHCEQAELSCGADATAGGCLLLHRHAVWSSKEQLDQLLVRVEADAHRILEGLGAEHHAFVPALCALAATRREALDRARRYWSQVPEHTWHWQGDPAALSCLAETAALLGDRERAAQLYQRLLPACGRDVSWGVMACVWAGPVDRVLALLAESLGQHAQAERHFAAALARLRQLGARPYLARTLYEHARALLARGVPGDGERAQALLVEARALAEELAQTDLCGLIAARQAGLASAPAAVKAARPAPFGLIREGEYWSVSWKGPPVRLKHSRGLDMLSRLLAEPGRRFHARELAAQGASAAELAGAGGDAGEQLDPAARQAYGARLAELDAALAEAETCNDSGRVLRLSEEREFILQELTRALGLGGRPRRAKSNDERARTAVQRRLRDAIERIRQAAPEVGRHLERAVRTGTYCVYSPGTEPAS